MNLLMKNRYSMKVSTFALVVVSAMTFGLASCQTGVDSVVPAADGVAGGSAKGGGAVVASADDMRKVLSPEERKRKIAEFLAKPEVKQTSQGLEELAKLVAVAVEDESLRNQVYARCMEKFDGETNVLWKHLDNDSKLRSSAGGGFSERIDALASKRLAASGSVVRSLGNTKAALAKFEKTINCSLHLFWAFPENWDKKTTPLIAFVPIDAEMKSRRSIPAFDAKGNVVIVDEAMAKQRPVLVLTTNERTDITGKLTFNISRPNAKSVAGQVAAGTHVIITVVDLKMNADWYDGWFGGGAEFRAVSREPGGLTNLDVQDFEMTRGSLPAYIQPLRPIKAATVANATQIIWWERDESVGEWALGPDDELTGESGHQVPVGAVNQGFGNAVHGAAYSWAP